MGRQWVGALVNLVSYYGAALPLGIWLAFNGWGLQGLWIGQCGALYLVGVLEWIIVGLCNWDKEVKRALGRIEDDETVKTVGEGAMRGDTGGVLEDQDVV